MLKNVLDELYFGEIRLCDKMFLRDTRFAEYSKRLVNCEETLLTYLGKYTDSEEARKALTTLVNTHDELQNFCELDRFFEGFRLGARFMLDTFVTPQQSALRDIE